MIEELWADTAVCLILKTHFNSCFCLGFSINLMELMKQ